MKKKVLFFILLLTAGVIWAQKYSRDSLRNIINLQRGDTIEVKAILNLVDMSFNNASEKFVVRNIDSIFNYLQKALLLAKKIDYSKGEAECYLLFSRTNGYINNYGQQISFLFKALQVYEQLNDQNAIAAVHINFQGIYKRVGDYKNSLSHAFAAKKLVETNDMSGTRFFMGFLPAPLISAEIGETYFEMNKLDSALFYVQKAIEENFSFNSARWDWPIYLLGKIQDRQGKYSLALETYRSAISLALQNKISKDTLDIYNSIAVLYKKTGKLDSAIHYANQITNTWDQFWPIEILLLANSTLADVYKLKGVADSTLKYTELRDILKDSISRQERQKEIQSITFNEQLKQQQILSSQNEYKKTVQLYALTGGLIALILIAAILWRNNRQKRKVNALLQEQKQEIQIALTELKATQAQLVQREKMAALGELTAGIAHEIQNPLNFVNNFSEVNKELIDEAWQANAAGNSNEVEELLTTLRGNEDKISNHGKRADSIVKGMLQHSRESKGHKEPTDINALADEYLRISYQGLRAKDKAFNASLQTSFDPKLSKVDTIPQDIGSVLLNLYNNGFYAISEKKKKQPEGYEPSISVRTTRIDNKVEIRVKDNGIGIPEKVLEKIFHPFFTTKPTGQGTGLGLSLSYDIIKAHGGEIKVDTKEGEFTEFVIQLPISASA